METTPHKPWYIVLVVANLVLLLALFFLNAANGAQDLIPGLFERTISNLSSKYYVEITPAGWTFSIWGIIYTWQAIWVLYSLVLLCRKGKDGPAYLNPVLLPPLVFVFYMCANVCCIGWLFLFDREVIEGAFVSILGIPIFLAMGMIVSYRALDAASPQLVEQNRTCDIWLVRGFVHNAFGIYATWTSIASLLNLAMVIRYRSDPVIGDQTAATVALAVLTVFLLVFYSTDLLLLDRYSRYTLTPYGVVVVALIGSIAKNWKDGATNSIFSAVLLGLASAALILKLVMTIYRHFTRTRYPSHMAPTIDNYKGGRLA